MPESKILIVEDEAIIALDLERRLEDLGYEVCANVATGQAALGCLDAQKPDLILMDIVLKSGMDGVEAAEKIRAIMDVPVVFMTGAADEERIHRAVSLEPFGYLPKPFRDRDLKAAVEMALYKARLDDRRKQAEKELKIAHAELEIRVRDRTAELVEANRILQQQMEELKEAEKALIRSEEKYRTIVDTAHEGVWLLDGNFRAIYVNRRMTQMFGRPREDFIGKGIHDFIDKDSIAHAQQFFQGIITGKSARNDIRFRRHDGKDIWTIVSGSPLYGDDGDFQGVLAMVVDISRRVEAERELLKKERELERQARKLEEANIGLKVLIQHREEEKSASEKQLINSVEKLLSPLINRMKGTKLDPRQEAYLSVLESNLAEITSRYAGRLSSRFLTLTPSELEIAGMIRSGSTSAEIARLLNISENGVEFHRKNIRSKLGLKHKKINLRTYLQQM